MSDMSNLGLILLVLVGIAFLASIMEHKSNLEQEGLQPNGKPKCPPHKWVYKKLNPNDEQEYMVCDQCKHTPSSL